MTELVAMYLIGVILDALLLRLTWPSMAVGRQSWRCDVKLALAWPLHLVSYFLVLSAAKTKLHLAE